MFKPLLLSLSVTAASAPALAADPFESCPTQAFLVQSSPAKLYGVDLSTGSYETLAPNVGAAGVVNAVGFSFFDQFIYGWDKNLQTLVRIGSDYEREALTLTEPLNGHYYVGDVSTAENTYFMYRRGTNELHGLWKISLDENSANYLTPERITDGSNFLMIYDFAFHPDNGLLYSVNSRGRLIQIDPGNGESQIIGNTGETGTFGAIYFDVDGMLYMSRNKDGKIFRLDPLSPNIQAEEFAQGPSSSSNDGARCAFAPVVPVDDVPQIDFGDAPASYQTSLADNGARHGRADENLYLGSGVDFETQAYMSPVSDESVNESDEDGISFITTVEAGKPAIVRAEANGSGFLNGWIDFNRNGQFENSEQVISDEAISNQSRNFVFNAPNDLVPGATWSRFRLSASTGTGIGGGVPAGEVEDHEITLTSLSATTLYYPSANGFVTLAYEDLWPSVGDYDMNDFVVHYRTATRFDGNEVIGVTISGEMMAIGATFHNGFGVQLPGVPREAVNQSKTVYKINGDILDTNPLEEGQTNVVLIFTDDIWNYVTPAEACSFYRTEDNCADSNVQATFSISIEFNQGMSADAFADRLFDPFIFATPGFNRSSIFDSPPGRALEIHLKNRAPTDLADPALLGRSSDRSNAGNGLYYQTQSGLPWAAEIGTE